MQALEIKKASEVLKRLSVIRKSIKENELETFGLHWITDKRKKHISALYTDLKELTSMGIDNKVFNFILGIVKDLYEIYNLSDELRISRLKKYSSPDTISKINQYLDQIIMQLDFIASREAYVLDIVNKKTFREMIERYGSKENFVKTGLAKSVINRQGDANFKGAYDLYLTIFTLPSEQESLEGFEEVLGFNANTNFKKKFGPFEEAWIVLKEKKTRMVLGAVNFNIYKMPDYIAEKTGVSGTNTIIYIYVHPYYRSMGLGQKLLNLMYEYSEEYLKSNKILYFCEQNSPTLMSLSEYFEDNKNAKIDQCDRLKWWTNRGFCALDFRYYQLPLNSDSEVCGYLTFNVKASSGTIISGEVVIEHLIRFFEISVLKGDDPNKNEYYLKQVADIQNSIKRYGGIKTVREDFVSLKSRIGNLVNKSVINGDTVNKKLNEILS